MGVEYVPKEEKKTMKTAVVVSSQMAKYNRMDVGFFVMSDEIKEDVARLEKQFDRQYLTEILMSFPGLTGIIYAIRIGVGIRSNT